MNREFVSLEQFKQVLEKRNTNIQSLLSQAEDEYKKSGTDESKISYDNLKRDIIQSNSELLQYAEETEKRAREANELILYKSSSINTK